ncbi:endonuclease III [uncultured Methanobrevibacter sp.]|uniref:endonuclease III n=1 Tax=uncultured Methanobrevibacter sp. TaxID=253161 RepID=UPI0025E0DB00|nr:endonuclease III [uncultured Methanobrevibacter sp.]
MSKTDRVIKIVEELNNVFEIRVFLDHDPYKVLVRTILSQRTRDENTDQATNNLFSKYKNIYEVVEAPTEDVQELIKPAGFYRVKAGRIQEVSQILIDQYGGEVPDTLEELVKLPGVGRKTANCVLVFAFELPAIPVDTHVHRISNRMGLVNTKNPDETEFELSKIAPKELWIKLNDLMVQFGQNICKPTSPQCEMCPVNYLCDYGGS